MVVFPTNYKFPEPEEGTTMRTFVGPKTDTFGSQVPRITPGPAHNAITPDIITDVQDGRTFIYLWGWIKYHDVFPRTPEHITHFCWNIIVGGNPRTYVPNTPGLPPTPHTLQFQNLYHLEGNFAD
jgi:hypothetical protein